MRKRKIRLPNSIKTRTDLDAYLEQLGRYMVSKDGLGRELVRQFAERTK